MNISRQDPRNTPPINNVSLDLKLIPICNTHIKILQDSLGNYSAHGFEEAINKFYENENNSSFDRETTERQLRKLADATIQFIRKGTLGELSGEASLPLPRSTIQRAPSESTDPIKAIVDNQINSSNKSPPPSSLKPMRVWKKQNRVWTEEEDKLLCEVIATFKNANPTMPFWNNPLSEVEFKLWEDLETLYKIEAEKRGLSRPVLASGISRRWKETLCPSRINQSINKNKPASVIIKKLYDETTGTFEERCSQVEKLFCAQQADGTYYPKNAIKGYLNYHIFKTHTHSRPGASSLSSTQIPAYTLEDDESQKESRYTLTTHSSSIANPQISAQPTVEDRSMTHVQFQEETDFPLSISETANPRLETNILLQPHNWTPKEDELLKNIIPIFKMMNPTKSFWDNPSSKVDVELWNDIQKIYQSFAATSGLTSISAADIECRWKEALNPLLIKDPIYKNAGHAELIGNLYDNATGDFETRAQHVEKEFCLQQNGSYYLPHKIRTFLHYYASENPSSAPPQNAPPLDAAYLTTTSYEVSLPVVTTGKRSSEESYSSSKKARAPTKVNDLIIAAITIFKEKEPSRLFWDNPLSSVEDNIWNDIKKIYWENAQKSGLKNLTPSAIKLRWKQSLSPFIIKTHIQSNSNHASLIKSLYEQATGTFEARCSQAEIEFCRLQENGSYYPANRIGIYIKTHVLNAVPQNSSSSNAQEDPRETEDIDPNDPILNDENFPFLDLEKWISEDWPFELEEKE